MSRKSVCNDPNDNKSAMVWHRTISICLVSLRTELVASRLKRQWGNRLWLWSNGNIFRVTGPLSGNSPVTSEFPSHRLVTRGFDVFFDLRLDKRLNGWVNNREAGDLRRHRAYYDVIVMLFCRNPQNRCSVVNEEVVAVVVNIYTHIVDKKF